MMSLWTRLALLGVLAPVFAVHWARADPQAANFEVGHKSARMTWLDRVRALSSLLPRDLETLGVIVSVVPESREYTIRRFYHVHEVPDFAQLQYASYQITWGVRNNNGMFLRLPFKDSDPCITEGSIKRGFGTGKHWRSHDRHLAPGQKLPPGMRPWHDSYEYPLENGFNLKFGFDDACASDMEISQPMPPTWSPQLADLEK